MTDKQIIINNIDVSECEHLTETRHCKAKMAVMGTDANKCKCFPNCYYKQLKRKEQKFAKIKQYIEDNEWCILDNIYKELKHIIDGKENE